MKKYYVSCTLLRTYEVADNVTTDDIYELVAQDLSDTHISIDDMTDVEIECESQEIAIKNLKKS